MTDIDVYDDPIIRLTRDPDLNKEKEKTHELIRLINGFPPKERRISKLCSSSFSILQSLEKMSLKLRNWEFMSLDINSNYHFKNNDDQIKDFNHNIADKVLDACKELNKKLNKIANDIDIITRASKTLTPIEFISDSGTMLTSLVLRNIKLKNEIVDSLTVAYSKAKIIVIGRDLESMLTDSNDKDESTILSYKNFIISLLKQLNTAIEMDDNETKYECMAVVNDMEKIFDAFKLEKIKEAALSTYQHESSSDEEEFDIIQEGNDIPQEQYIVIKTEKDNLSSNPTTNTSMASRKKTSSASSLKSPLTTSHSVIIDEDTDYDSDMGTNSLYASSYTQPPLIHSITKANDNNSVQRKDSFSTISNSSILQKTTISDELPYLMTAFNSAKNIEEDITHFKQKNGNESSTNNALEIKRKAEEKKQHESTKERHFIGHSTKLPHSSLYSESTILTRPPQNNSASSYLYSNNSLLYKLGIKPQIITTEMTQKELNNSTKHNQLIVSKERIYPTKEYIDEEENDRENNNFTALTKANLESHTFSSLSTEVAFNDYVE